MGLPAQWILRHSVTRSRSTISAAWRPATRSCPTIRRAKMEVEECGTAPYRPVSWSCGRWTRTRFNHTVLLNWQNVSAGYEQPAPSGGELYQGYAWVGVSAQEIGLYGPPLGMGRVARASAKGMMDEDPERYGMLQHPGDPGSFDIFADAARVVGPGRSTAVDPLAGLDVHHVVAVGGSQSAMRLVSYANALHLRHRVIDGYALTVWEGRSPDLMDGPISFGGARTVIRDDLEVPVVVVNSEFEALALHLAGAVDSKWIRYWEVAGTPHGVTKRSDLPNGRGLEAEHPPIQPGGGVRASVTSVGGWRTGDPPRRFPVSRWRPAGRRAFLRDAHGNALGGIRLPELEVPVAEYQGAATGTGLPPLFGAARPFGEDQLTEMYPSRERFEARWRRAVDALVAQKPYAQRMPICDGRERLERACGCRLIRRRRRVCRRDLLP